MKKIILVIAFALTTQFAVAQDDAFKADVLKVIKMSGATAQMDAAKKQIMAMVAEAKQADFSKDFDAAMPAFYDKLAVIYMKEYTHADVKEMIKFYESPVGKKMAEKAGVLFEQSMLAQQEWGAGLQELMMKYMQ